MRLSRLETLLPQCLQNAPSRRRFLRGVSKLGPAQTSNEKRHKQLLEAYRLALLGRDREAYDLFMDGYRNTLKSHPILAARFQEGALGLRAAERNGSDLDELCQWLSAALHDDPAQKLSYRRLSQPQDRQLNLALDSLMELMRWLRNPILEGARLTPAIQEWLHLNNCRAQLKIHLTHAPRPIEQSLYRIFQELSELRLPLEPRRIHLSLRPEGAGWLALWQDDATDPISLDTIPERAASAGGRVTLSYQPCFRAEIRYS